MHPSMHRHASLHGADSCPQMRLPACMRAQPRTPTHAMPPVLARRDLRKLVRKLGVNCRPGEQKQVGACLSNPVILKPWGPLAIDPLSRGLPSAIKKLKCF
jgi:hypothetical protein